MAKTSNIAWCDSTFNPWIGCTKIGPGCDHCYAEAQDSRKRWGNATHWGAGVPRHRTSTSYWKQPLAWNRKAAESGKPWRVFCASLADVFDNEVDPMWRFDLFQLIRATPNLSWLLVTKRIGNVKGMMNACGDYGCWPDNARLMITVVNQEEADRDIPKLLALNCKNGISYEPALGPVHFGPYLSRDKIFSALPGFKDPMGGVQWVIIGGESDQGGHKARPFNVEWARSTIRLCKVAGTACFVKQLGSFPVDTLANLESVWWPIGGRDRCHQISESEMECRMKDRAGADPSEWPEDLRVREFPE